MTKPKPKKAFDFPAALKSFLGYLEGTEKAAHTIRSYRLDLVAFEAFLRKQNGRKEIRCELLSTADLEQYHHHLKTRGHRTNTRRRKLLTAQRFVRYLSKRKKLLAEVPNKMPAPQKMERIPLTLPLDDLLETIRALPVETLLDRRNRALLWTLAETGCQVSEVTQLRFDDWHSLETGRNVVSIPGKSGRTLEVSRELVREIESLKAGSKSESWVFLGHNRHGSLGGPISPRGVELLVRSYSEKLGQPELTPRIFRHSVVVHWLKKEIPQAEIQKRLGLKSAYAFRAYSTLTRDKSI